MQISYSQSHIHNVSLDQMLSISEQFLFFFCQACTFSDQQGWTKYKPGAIDAGFYMTGGRLLFQIIIKWILNMRGWGRE